MPALLALRQSVEKLWRARAEERCDLEGKVVSLMDVIEEQHHRNDAEQVSS